MPAPAPSTPGKKQKPPLPPARKLGWGAAFVVLVAGSAHWLDAHPIITIAAIVLAAAVTLFVIHNLENGD